MKLIAILATISLLFAATASALQQIDDLLKIANKRNGVKNDREQDPKGKQQCGYQSCPATKKDKVNVHLVAHTHDDVGWLKTVDQYFYGTKKGFSGAGVQFILDSVIPELLMDKQKRFIYVEMSFFTKWWREQDEAMRSAVKMLVSEGRFEFINGGWCMNDEATVTYQSTIEQMTLGLRFLNQTFGECGHPKVGWQIDPFGHSNEQASLFAQFGFDGMHFTRISQEDKVKRTANKSLDLIWHGDRLLGGQGGSIFTSIFRDGYDAPNGFCFDALCKDDQLVDNKDSYEYNMKQKGDEFIKFVEKYAQAKLTNHVQIPVGGDFQFTAANQNFRALDKLIKYMRQNAPNLHVFYSTPSCYQYSIYNSIREAKINLPEKYDDFMPYASTSSVWWSGYFASRPSVKLVERRVSNLLPVARMVSLASLLSGSRPSSWIESVDEHESMCLLKLWEILGDLQHHDAVTGTEKQHVADDYVRRADVATRLCAKFIGDRRRNDSSHEEPKLAEDQTAKVNKVYLESTMFCPLLNISECDALESEVDLTNFRLSGAVDSEQLSLASTRSDLILDDQQAQPPILTEELKTRGVLLTVYNPLARPVPHYDIRLPCNWRCDLSKIKVIHLASNNSMKLTRLVVPRGISTLRFRKAITNYEILFYANIPALGYTSFVIEDLNQEADEQERSQEVDGLPVTSDKSKTLLNHLRAKRSPDPKFDYFEVGLGGGSRKKRDSSASQQDKHNRVDLVVDTTTGMLVGIKRLRDGSYLDITQKFGFYFPADTLMPPGAYIFRPNSSEPLLLDKPEAFRLFKRGKGNLFEIHQKWTDWIWQTIRFDSRKNYIEFDYVIGPIPTVEFPPIGREVVTRYSTSISNDGVFLTDSNGRQLLARHKYRKSEPEQLGGSFFPVVSSIMLRDTGKRNATNRNSVGSVAILVDRSQAGTSLNDGQLELLVHRRQMRDDHFGVDEALNEPGEDGLGLVTRGSHRLFLNFKDELNLETGSPGDKPQMFELPATPRANLRYEQQSAVDRTSDQPDASPKTYVVHDKVYDELRREALKFASRPVLTFDRLRVGANDFAQTIAAEGLKVGMDFTMLNATLPKNVHLLTLQPWNMRNNSILIRLENLDNPLTLHPFPDLEAYNSLRNYYKAASDFHESGTMQDNCNDLMRAEVEVDIEYLIKKIRIVALEELKLGADVRLTDSKRLNWTEEVTKTDECHSETKPAAIRLAPRQIRTFLVDFEYL